MARMRTLKPEFWEDEAVGCLSRDARLLYMATWNAADDEGILRWNAAFLKSQAFIYDDDLTVTTIEALMAELVEGRMIFPYRGGKAKQPLALIVKFHKHQRPNRPQESKMPPPSLQSPQVAAMYAERDDWTCHICNEPIPHGDTSGTDKRFWLSLDHVRPRSKGGSDFPSNIRASHSKCNSSKKDRVPSEEPAAHPAEPTGDESFTEAFSEPRTAVVVGVSRGTGEGTGGVREAAPRRGTRLSENWTPSIDTREWTVNQIGQRAVVELEKFRNYWLSKSGKDAAKLDWDRTWRNWVLTAAEQHGRASPNGGSITDERTGQAHNVADQFRREQAHARRELPA